MQFEVVGALSTTKAEAGENIMRNLEEMNGIYKDTPCFIICPGPSVAAQNLEPLKNYVTIAVNSGYLAAPWANYFLSDDW